METMNREVIEAFLAGADLIVEEEWVDEEEELLPSFEELED